MYSKLCEQAIRETFGNKTRISSFDPITDGYRNLTASVTCDGHPAPMFFKIEKPFLFPRTQKHQIEREKAGLLVCAQHGIPVPKLIAAGDGLYPWLLESFVPGKPLSNFSLTSEERIHIAKEFETIFQKLCQIRSDHYGDTFDGGFIGKHKEWKQALWNMTQIVFDDGNAIGLWSSHASILQSALQKALAQIEDDSEPVFYHCDLFSANVMGEPDETGLVHLRSIIDFGMSLYAPLQYVRSMTQRYCDLIVASHENKIFENEKAYQILRIEPLLLMKLFQYPNTENAIEEHVKICQNFLEE